MDNIQKDPAHWPGWFKTRLNYHTWTEAIIVDITCPYEGGADALKIARDAKLTKYNPLARELLERRFFDRVSVEPIVDVSLGSWDPRNDKFISRLCSKKV